MTSASVVDLFGERPKQDLEVTNEALRNDFVGRAGEYVAAAALSELGVVVHHVPAPGYDLIANAPDGLVRIQVKTTAQADSKYRFVVLKEVGRHTAEGKRTKRPLDRRDCDVVALVALDKRRAIFLPVEKIDALNVAVTAQEYETPDIERISWLACQ